MTRTRTASTSLMEPKTHRRARTPGKKPARVPSAPEFDAAAHHDEIAETAYFHWLERTGSAEENWLKAELEVRAKYSQS
jgi:hypothetical protein